MPTRMETGNAVRRCDLTCYQVRLLTAFGYNCRPLATLQRSENRKLGGLRRLPS